MHAMPLLLAILCLMAIAYRYYSAFLAAKVAALDDSNPTPASLIHDGQNYHPTNKWVLFGHHFAAISGAGPLIGPVLAAQFGYMPGLLWIVIGVCLAGAVQDFLSLAASIRRGGKSLAQIAYADIGRVAGIAATAAILFIIVIALAGLGKVVVKALGGETVAYPKDSMLIFPGNTVRPWGDTTLLTRVALPARDAQGVYIIPAGTKLIWNNAQSVMTFTDSFPLKTLTPFKDDPYEAAVSIPPGSVRLVPGSAWGTFTIAATVPIALFVGLYMYKLRKGRVVEASLIGGALTLLATFIGGWVSQQAIGQYFNLTATQVTIAIAAYGFIASVLPVWVLLCPRDYLSSFLKIGTITLLFFGTLLSNPKLEAPAFNHVYYSQGPTVSGSIFPFLVITIMCGAISGFHALVSSGTTPKMIKKETDARVIGYGAMLIEALVGVVAMIAAATLPVQDYYAMNTDLARVPLFQDKILQVAGGGGIEHLNAEVIADNLPRYERLTQESLRGRTGGAVTLAVGMAHIFDQAASRVFTSSQDLLDRLWKYWYHFAIMFEALFILTTIDTGTRIGRFLLQEAAGSIHPKLGQTSWWPGAILSTAIMVFAWTYFMQADSFAAIWAMFGVANQLLAVIAMAVLSAYLINQGRARYLAVTVIPMVVVLVITSTAALDLLTVNVNTLSV
ncbi:MAG TPA: carbon starvation protein A, partial [Tepidisphaeraceae bacterium]|nr:carbon starvation protein A [Tepidisphaeraceae bacterium]